MRSRDDYIVKVLIILQRNLPKILTSTKVVMSSSSSVTCVLTLSVPSVHLLMQFLDQTASQLTYHGLAELHQHIEDNTFCVLYRNLHFSTLYKHNGSLYILVTDQGYANKPGIVWERLDQVDGNTVFVDSDFKVFDPKSDYSPSAVYDPDESSELYARKLQEKFVLCSFLYPWFH